jgi:HSP20 family protein
MMWERSLVTLIERVAAAPAARGRGCWYPAADLYRTERGWLVKLDLAGIDPQQVCVVRRANRFTVAGCRRDWLVQQGVCSYSLEISYNDFERTLELPEDIEHLEMRTEYRDGMLLVWLTGTAGR